MTWGALQLDVEATNEMGCPGSGMGNLPMTWGALGMGWGGYQ